jgi:hypothetical protein
VPAQERSGHERERDRSSDPYHEQSQQQHGSMVPEGYKKCQEMRVFGDRLVALV